MTIVVSGNETKTKTGWKDKKKPSLRLLKRTAMMPTQQKLEIDCIERKPYNISEVVTNVKFGIGIYSKTVKNPWNEDFSNAYAG